MRKIALFVGLLLAPIYAHATWDASTPSGSESKSLGDDRIRELKTDIATALEFEGVFPGTNTSSPIYIWTPSSGTTANRPTGLGLVDGRLYVNTSSGCLEHYNATTAQWSCFDVVPSSNIVGTDLSTTVAGPGLYHTGTALAVRGDETTISVTGGSVTVKANGIGTSQIAQTGVTISSLAFTLNQLYASGFPILPILQIQTAEVTSASTTAVSAYVRSGLSVNITPKFSTSKILVFAFGTFDVQTADVGYYSLGRDTGGAITNMAGSAAGFHAQAFGTSGNLAFFDYDSPSSTVQQRYSVIFKAGPSASVSFPSGLFSPVTSAQIIAVEIAQ